MNKKREAEQYLDDIKMRRGLMEFLWQFKEYPKGVIPQPFVMMDDEQIKNELKRILH